MLRKGFTLVEMVMVMVIIGLLAAVIIPKFMIDKDRTKMIQTKATLDALRKAVLLYYADNHEYPGYLWHVTEEAVRQGQADKAYLRGGRLSVSQILPYNAFTETFSSDNGPTVGSCCSSAWCYNWNTGEVFVGAQGLSLPERIDIEGVDICTY